MTLPAPLRRIFVADDEETVRRLLHDALTRAGFEVELASHGRELLSRYRSGAYGLLILDVRMSPRTGLEVVEHLREQGDTVPIILMSTVPKRSDRMAPLASLYRAELLRKPFSLGELREAVRKATSRPDA